MDVMRTRLAAAAIVLAMAGCQPAQPAASAQPTSVAPAQAATDRAAACPEADFDAFLTRFAADPAFQKAWTADPLTMDKVDAAAQPEPAVVTSQVPRADVSFPLLAQEAKRMAEGVQTEVAAVDGEMREVTVRIPESDAQHRLRFRADPCWTLVRFSDDSL
jgi:hypothetical protein